jgi:hypothetical protein
MGKIMGTLCISRLVELRRSESKITSWEFKPLRCSAECLLARPTKRGSAEIGPSVNSQGYQKLQCPIWCRLHANGRHSFHFGCTRFCTQKARGTIATDVQISSSFRKAMIMTLPMSGIQAAGLRSVNFLELKLSELRARVC